MKTRPARRTKAKTEIDFVIDDSGDLFIEEDVRQNYGEIWNQRMADTHGVGMNAIEK